jgi:WD40 repeat protein
VAGVALHPQGSQCLTADSSGQIKLWDLQPPKNGEKESDKPLKLIAAHPGGATAVAFHGNGAQGLSGGADRTVKLWNLTTGQLVRAYGPLPDPIRAVVFSRDYTQLGTAAGRLVKVWNVADGKELATLHAPAAVTSLAFSPDRLRLATGGADHVVRVWELANGLEVEYFRQAGPVLAVAFHPNNQSIVSSNSEKVAVVNTLALGRLIVASAAPVRALALAPTGAHVLAGGDDKTVKLWNLGNGVNERSFSGAEAPITSVTAARNGVLLAVGSADKTVRLFTFADARQQALLTTSATVRALAFSPNNQVLAAAGDEKTLSTWQVLFNPGQTVQPDFGKPGPSFAQVAATCVTFAPDSTRLYAGGLDRTLKEWKFPSDQPLKNFGHPNYVDAVAFNAAGTELATGCHDGVVRIWHVAKGQPVRQISAHIKPAVAPVYCVAWSPDGKQLVSGSFDHSLKLWEAGSGKLIREFRAYKEKEFDKGHRDGVYCVAFSPDGKFLASAGNDRAIKIWNGATGQVVRDLVNPNLKAASGAVSAVPSSLAHPGPINGLCYTPDGAYLISAGGAPRFHGYLAAWQVDDGKLVYAEEAAVGNYQALAMTANGRLLGLACGPRGPGSQFTDVPSYVLKTPVADRRQTMHAGK